jgi:hypothetical protein
MIEQITPLRRHMIEDMSLRNTLPATQRVYVNAVKTFSAFFGRSPDKLTFEDVRTTSFISSYAGSSHHHQPDPVRLAVSSTARRWAGAAVPNTAKLVA